MGHRQPGAGHLVQEDVGSGTAELLGDLDRPGSWMLMVDGVPQSHVDLEDPEYLDFEYMRRLGHLADLAAPAGEPLRTLHLGAGGLTLARYIAVTRPGSPQVAVEADAALAELVRRRLPLPRPGRAGGRVRVRIGDARAELAGLRAASFGLVVADVFRGAQTPAHLTSAEFDAEVARVLRPGGWYGINVGDGPPLAHLRARVATVRSVFRHAILVADPSVLRGRRFGNLVLAASQQQLPVATLARRAAADPFPGRVVDGDGLARLAAGAAPITDAVAGPSPAPPPEVFGALGDPGR
jgi:spermidine synthase